MAGEAYVKRYTAGFINDDNSKPADAQFLNAVETALLRLLGADPIDQGVQVWDVALARMKSIKLTASQIDPAAAILKSQLAALGIVNADVAAGAAIAASKLGSIPISKLSDLASTSNLAVSISSANTDLAAPVYFQNVWYITVGGGSLRSIGAGVLGGQRISIRNATSSAVTLKQYTAGGAGAPLYFYDLADRALAANEVIEFVWDSATWVEFGGARTRANFKGTTADGTFTLIDINTSTTESDMIGTQGSGWTIPANTLGVKSKLRVVIEGDIIHVGSATPTITFRVYLGGTKYIDAVYTFANFVAPTRSPLTVEVDITTLGATNSEHIVTKIDFEDTNTSPTTGLGYLGATGTAVIRGHLESNGLANADMTAGQALRVTGQWGTSNAANQFRVRQATVEVL